MGASQKRPLERQLKAVTQPSTQQIKKMRGLEYGRLCKKKKLCSCEKGSPAWTSLPRKEVEGSFRGGLEKGRN